MGLFGTLWNRFCTIFGKFLSKQRKTAQKTTAKIWQNLKNLRWEGWFWWSNKSENIWSNDLGVNTKLVLGLPRANQVGLEHAQKNLRRCERWLEDPPPPRYEPVMSMNNRIFEYLIEMALKYYSSSYSCHFPSTNIFGYSFIDFWTTEYIRIFVRKSSKIRLCLNICSEPYFHIQPSIVNEKSTSRYNLCIRNIQCKILFRENISECFKKNSSISDEYVYSNIQIKWPSNIICICIRAISGIGIYSDICSVNMLHPDIFGYSFGT